MYLELITGIAFYAILATALFNIFRYQIKTNLPSSFALSFSFAFLLVRFLLMPACQVWFTENIWSVIVLCVLITVVALAVNSPHNKNKLQFYR